MSSNWLLSLGMPASSLCKIRSLVALVTENSLPKIRLAKVRNSNSLNSGTRVSLDGSTSSTSSQLISIGTSSCIVANFLESRAMSACSRTFSCCLPFSSEMFESSPSTVSYFAISFSALLGPMPGIPGILSAVSPQSPSISMT